MKYITLFCLIVASAFAQAQDVKSGYVTIFREHGSGSPQYVVGDKIPGQMQWEIYLDGIKEARIKVGEFVTFKLPAGEHELRMSDVKEIVKLNVKPDGRIYIRPTAHAKFVLNVTAEVVPCSSVAAVADGIKPINPKHVFLLRDYVADDNPGTCGR